tara:strand:- start:1883 stop:2266 length:384 start_codon:yes stop_codon:yes gene_type:complete
MSTVVKSSLLVVDDDNDILRFFDATLEDLGVDFHGVSSSKEFKGAYQVGQYSAFVADIVMPQNDAFELVDWLKNQDCQRPVIFITAFSQYLEPIAEYAKARGLRLVGTWRKPLQRADIEQMIKAISR